MNYWKHFNILIQTEKVFPLGFHLLLLCCNLQTFIKVRLELKPRTISWNCDEEQVIWRTIRFHWLNSIRVNEISCSWYNLFRITRSWNNSPWFYSLLKFYLRKIKSVLQLFSCYVLRYILKYYLLFFNYFHETRCVCIYFATSSE